MRRVILAALIAFPAAAQVQDETGAQGAYTPDRSTTCTLAALNATCSVALEGRQGAGALITTANLNATIVAEASQDGGTTWGTAWFSDYDLFESLTLISFTGGSATRHRAISFFSSGTTHVRLRVSVYTSGTSAATLRATLNRGELLVAQGALNFPWIVQGSAGDGSAVFGSPVRIAGKNGSTTQDILTDANGELQIDVLSSALPSGAATSALQDGIVKDGSGDTTQANVSEGSLHSTTPDRSATCTLDSLNDTCVVALEGRQGAGFFLTTSNLSATVRFEVSFDGGTTWVDTYFIEPVAWTYSATAVFTGSSTTASRSWFQMTGPSHVRARVSAYTSGTSTATLRASEGTMTALNIVQGWTNDGFAVDSAPVRIAGKNGSTTQDILTDANGELQVDVLSSALPSGAATSANQDGIVRDGTGDTTQANVSSGRLQVDGSGVTQPVSGTVSVTEPVSVDDNAGSLTVDAPTGTPVNVQIGDASEQATVRDTGTSDSLNVAIVDGSGNQVTSFGGGTQYVEDDAAAANPTGTAPILVRDDTPNTQVTTDGDNVAQRGTNYGAAYVQVVSSAGAFIDSFGGSGGTAQADRSAFTDGTTTFTPVGGTFNETNTNPTEDQAAAARITQERALHVNLRDATGDIGVTVTGSNALKVDGSAATQPVSGTVTATATDLDIRNLNATDDIVQARGAAADGAAVTGNPVLIAGQDGTNAQSIKTDSTGSVQVDVETMPTVTVTATDLDVQIGGSDSLTIGTFPDNEPINVAQMNGVAVTMGNGVSGTGVQRVTIASDSTGQVAVASLPNEGQQTAANSISVTPDTDNDAIGATAAAVPGEAVYVAGTDGTNVTPFYVDPCQREARTVYRVDIVTATTTEIAAATASEFYWICSVNLVTAAANNVIIVEDDSATNCPSPTAGVSSGGTTAAEGFNFAANGGIVVGTGSNWVMKTTTANRSFCIITSAATQLSGTITYVSAP
jgi:hypothetical protein